MERIDDIEMLSAKLNDVIEESANFGRPKLDDVLEARLRLAAEVVSRRRRYPKQCAEYLSSTLDTKLKALKKSTVLLPDLGPYSVNRRSYPKEVQQLMAGDQGDFRNQTKSLSKEIDDLTKSIQELRDVLKMIRGPQNQIMYDKLKAYLDSKK